MHIRMSAVLGSALVCTRSSYVHQLLLLYSAKQNRAAPKSRDISTPAGFESKASGEITSNQQGILLPLRLKQMYIDSIVTFSTT